MTGWTWMLATVLGVALLGLALYYGIRQSHRFRRDPRAVGRAEEATHRLYEEESRPER